MANLRKYYTKKFVDYPDMVDVLTFREMMGGIGDTFARRLIHEKRVEAIYIKPHYWINKNSIIEYILSDDYANRQLKVWE